MNGFVSDYKQILADWLGGVQSPEIRYAILIVLLFVVPRLLLRFGAPLAISAFMMGIVSNFFLEPLKGDMVISTFAFLGISALFLFAGLEVEISEIKRSSGVLLQHLAVRLLTMAVMLAGLIYWLDLGMVQAAIMALAILTPSTGFIMDSIESSQISSSQKHWVKTLAISAEIVALFFLVLLSKAHKPLHMMISLLVIILLTMQLPKVFKYMTSRMGKIIPGTEFSFMILLAVVMGLITKALGAYYLVGAFVVGVTAGRFRQVEQNLATEEHLKAVRLFAGFFMPFYFFSAGMRFETSFFNWESFRIAAILLSVTIPIKLFSVMLHRKFALKEAFKESFPISVSLLPTLIFGLVLADILRSSFALSDTIYAALVIYTIVVTISPIIIFKIFPYKKVYTNISGIEFISR